MILNKPVFIEGASEEKSQENLREIFQQITKFFFSEWPKLIDSIIAHHLQIIFVP